jgi:hypothetical protein
VAEGIRRCRARTVLEQQIAALTETRRSAPLVAAAEAAVFDRGAVAALRWLLDGGPGPLTGTTTAVPPPAAVVRELATART